MSLPCFTPAVPQLGIPFPSQGLPRARDSPASTVLWDAPTPCRPSRFASSPSLGGTPPATPLFVVRPEAAPTGPRRFPGGPGVCCAGCPMPVVRRGGDRTSQVPGGPQCAHAVLSDPDGTVHALAHGDASVLPSALMTASAPMTLNLSRLPGTARSLAVYASQRGLPHRHARLASGPWPGLAGRGWLPAGSLRKVSAIFIMAASSLTSSPRLYLAHH